MKILLFVTTVVLSYFSCDAAEITCPEATRPHKTECNKYYKCIRLPSNSLSWVTLTCAEGLIYDKNLLSCAIPSDNWDCFTSSEDDYEVNGDDSNVYGVENLEIRIDGDDDNKNPESDEFLEVIDGKENLPMPSESRTSNAGSQEILSEDDDSNSSGDGAVPDVTPSTPNVRMITTQVQRLSQLVNNMPKNSNEVTADDLNSFLDTQNIQLKSTDYQKMDFNSEDKTPMPNNGKIQPEILSEILDRQNQLNKLTTLPMEATTKSPAKPIFYINKEPITEIKLRSGQGTMDGNGAHQIVVNRPEGSVLFNVPPPTNDNSHQSNPPYLSEHILKTILELSKQMISNNRQKPPSNQENSRPQQPIYYAVPIPFLTPQNNVQNYYGQYQNHSMQVTAAGHATITTESPLISINRNQPFQKLNKNDNSNYSLNPSNYMSNYATIYHQTKPEDNFLKTQQQSLYYQNYPQYYNQYQQQSYSPYNAMNGYYQYPTATKHDVYNRFNGMYYENSPFVSDLSAPSYLEQQQQGPFRKESYSSSSTFNNDDVYDAFNEESDDDDDNASINEDDDEDNENKGPTSGLICTAVLARQANKTDCFTYYVCNAKTKEVLTYSCPPLTAFNDQTKFCDSGSYKDCKKNQDKQNGSKNNSKMYAEAQKALAQAKLESEKVQRIANMVKKQSQKMFNRKNTFVPRPEQSFSQDYYQSYIDTNVQTSRPLTITQRPVYALRKPIPSRTKLKPIFKTTKRKKKRVKCSQIVGNIPDPEDQTSYWHCFKSSDIGGKMKRIHKKCSANLIFCETTRYCSASC